MQHLNKNRCSQLHLVFLMATAILFLGPFYLQGLPMPMAASRSMGPKRAKPITSAAAAESAAEKLRRIRQASSDGTAPVQEQFSEEEVNSYMEYEMSHRYPAGVSLIEVRFLPGRISGTSEVDFDELKASGRTPGGMTDALFWGRHTLDVEGSFSAIDGVGQFDLESVALDGVTVPQMFVDLLIETFLKPHYPALALDSPFFLPSSIDRIQVLRESLLVEINPTASR